jgi:hypothetical protein
MTQIEFDDRMSLIDQALAASNCPIAMRSVHAWFQVSGKKQLQFLPRYENLGLFDGPNLYWSVQSWYTSRYPTKSLVGHDWGPRRIVIRGSLYAAQIPVIFNPSETLDAFQYFPEIPEALRQALTPTERTEINVKFNWFFRQGSDLALASSETGRVLGSDLALQLLTAGRADLRMASEYAFERNPGSVLFAAQQGPEKFLKALLVVKDPSLTEQKLKKDFGHRIPDLFEACLHFDTAFEKYRARITMFHYGQEVRYQASSITTQEAVDIIDLAHDLCHTVALHLLQHHSRPRNSIR